MRATNVSHGKLVNLWVVFETIRLHGPLSRSDIARLTTLSKPSVSSLVDELDELGLIREGALRTGGVGKPSTPLDLNPEGAFTLGLHLDYGRATAVLTDLIGGVRHREVWALDTSDQLRTLRTIARQIKGLLRKGKVDRTRLMGMGTRNAWPLRRGGAFTDAPAEVGRDCRPGGAGSRLTNAGHARQ